MAVFAVIQTQFGDQLEKNINTLDHLKIREGVWFVAEAGTAQDIATKLGVVEGTVGSAIITKISSYHGRTNPSTWDWLVEHWE